MAVAIESKGSDGRRPVSAKCNLPEGESGRVK